MNWRYLLFVIAAFTVDRITKLFALNHWREEYVINAFMSLQTTLNKGISWGILNLPHRFLFILITSGIIVFTVFLMLIAFRRYRERRSIIGEVLVITGSLSNIVDRFLYGGVVDFIDIHVGQWIWPSFNIADACIVAGVFIMFKHMVSYAHSA